MVDRHVDEQWLRIRVEPKARHGWGGVVAAEFDPNRVQPAERTFAHEVGGGSCRGKEAIVLADHQDKALRVRKRHQLLSFGERLGEGLFHQDVQAGLEAGAHQRGVPGDRGRDEQGIRPGGRDRVGKGREALLPRAGQPLVQHLQRGGI